MQQGQAGPAAAALEGLLRRAAEGALALPAPLLPSALRAAAARAAGAAGEARRGDEPLFWRINFSRVQWGLEVEGGRYVKRPSCLTCPEPGTAAEDNWVWSPQARHQRAGAAWNRMFRHPCAYTTAKSGSLWFPPPAHWRLARPQGAIAMHRPESWGFLQFSEEPVNSTPAAVSREWGLRSAAMALYYAQRRFREQVGAGRFSGSAEELLGFTDTPWALDGTCFDPPDIRLTAAPLTGTSLGEEEEGEAASIDGGAVGRGVGYVAWIRDPHKGLTAAVRDDRYLRVRRDGPRARDRAAPWPVVVVGVRVRRSPSDD